MKRRGPCKAIHQEESQSGYGRNEGGRRSVHSLSGVLGTCSEIRDVPVGDSSAGMQWGPGEELQKEPHQYGVKSQERL